MEMIELGPLMELSKAKEMVGMIIMPTCKYPTLERRRN
jgi:hypothetical protein